MRTKYGKTIVASVVVLVGIIVGVMLINYVKAEPMDTYHSSWHLIRETADEDGATLAVVYNLTTEGNFANKDTSTVLNGGAFRIVSDSAGIAKRGEGYSPGGAWIFALCAKNYNDVDDVFSFNIFGWSKTNGMLQNILEGSCVIGTQAVIVYPDGGDALGELVSETSVAYDDAGGAEDNYFTVTNAAFADVVVGMQAYVTGTNVTSGYYQVTVKTDSNNIKIAVTATDDNTDSTVQINPSFWIDTINVDETTKWPSVAVYNSGDDEVANIVVDVTGLEWIQFVIYEADAATNEEAGDVTVYGRRY